MKYMGFLVVLLVLAAIIMTILWFIPRSPVKTLFGIKKTINCEEVIRAEKVAYKLTQENRAYRDMCWQEGKSRITLTTGEETKGINCREQIKLLNTWHKVWVLAEICERLDVEEGTITLR